jgi:hypothetical protein
VLKKPSHRRKTGDSKSILSKEELKNVDLKKLLEKVNYCPNQKHKNYPIKGQKPYFDADSAKCPNNINVIDVEKWLKEAVKIGAISALRGDFPKCIWFKKDGIVYEAKQTNSKTGEYHGFPLEEYEWPHGIDLYYS